MSDWAEGYVTDIQYTGNFYRELSPTYLSFLAVLQGYHPPRLGKGATYCELGCGQGVGTAVLAASNPAMNFWGIDFNPGQIANAQRYAEAGGLANVTFLDHSFQQSVEAAPGVLPQFDFIALHGIYSWVSPENRAYIVRFIDRYLKPGGLVFVSYNCMPGWAAKAPVQRLIREHAKRNPGRSDIQAQAALAFVQDMVGSEAAFFSRQPLVAKQFDKVASKDRSYIAHEYLNRHWHPMYHADVVDEMQGARLNYIGSATLTENLDSMAVPASTAKMIKEAPDPVWAETLRDFGSNKEFRRDVFLRGASTLNQYERSAALNNLRFSLATPRAAINLKFTTPNGSINGNADYCNPILDALAKSPKTIGELNTIESVRARPASGLVQTLTLLLHTHQIHPMNPADDGKALAGGKRFNKAVANRMLFGESRPYFASPLLGTGIRTNTLEALTITALISGIPPNADKIADFCTGAMTRLGRRIEIKRKDTDDDAPPEDIKVRIQTLLAEQQPLWTSLGVI